MNGAAQNSKIFSIKFEIVAISWQSRLLFFHDFLLSFYCDFQSVIRICTADSAVKKNFLKVSFERQLRFGGVNLLKGEKQTSFLKCWLTGIGSPEALARSITFKINKFFY